MGEMPCLYVGLYSLMILQWRCGNSYQSVSVNRALTLPLCYHDYSVRRSILPVLDVLGDLFDITISDLLRDELQILGASE